MFKDFVLMLVFIWVLTAGGTFEEKLAQEPGDSPVPFFVATSVMLGACAIGYAGYRIRRK